MSGRARRAARAAATASRQTARTWAGAALLAIAAAASALLAFGHFGGSLPGCGPRSACRALEATAWGRLPGTAWPVSFVGLAYFGALLVAWLLTRGTLPPALRLLARGGAGVSLLYLAVMAALGKLCPTCLAAHVANLGFVGLRELAARRVGVEGRARPRAAAAFAVVFAAVSVALAVARQRHEADRAALAEKERASLVERVAQQAAGPDPSTADRWGTAGFTGRYRHGPESAPIRIVVFTDYQCPDCAQVEGEIERLLATRDDLSLSVKHFPMNAQCNPHVKETLHDNACWAARVAETAGIVGGEQAFWKMHRWLFSVHGIFVTTADLAEGVAAAGLDMASFIPVLEGHEPLQRIRADIEDGMALGLYFTPMVFVNGVEVKWSFSPMDSVTTAVEALAAKALPARTAVADRPALAAEKFVDDWRIQPARPVRPVQLSWPLGADGSSATVDVVVFGNYGAASVKQVDHELRDALMTRPHVRYSFRHYPLSADCNPALPENVQSSALEPLDCVASRAALAAGTVGGTSAFWRMHDFILARSSVRDEIDVREAARDIGLDEALVLRAMDEPRITTAIADDCHAARDLAIRSLPLVIVAGRRVPRPLREGDSILARIIDEASRAAPSAAASAP